MRLLTLLLTLLLTITSTCCAVDRWVITERLDGQHVTPPAPAPQPVPVPSPTVVNDPRIDELLAMVKHQNEIIDELKRRFGAIEQGATTPKASYPVRSSFWTHPGPSTVDNMVMHLSQGEHAGQFDPGYLKALSVKQLESLHSDAHEGRVNWNYAVRPASKTRSATMAAPVQSVCPGGVCPVRRR